ncbi:MAG: RluA family pseudouridine synthase [Kiritimatiellae bacterium]|nr:RluA family pseudouridine synthase [Kiritimatiellia bacterium]
MIEGASFICETGGIRLDAALFIRFPSSTRAFCREAVEAGGVAVNGRIVRRKGVRLAAGDRVAVARLDEARDNRVAPNPAVAAEPIFEDSALLAFDKPAALPVQPLTRRETAALANGVVARWPACAEASPDEPLMAGALHRLDAGTSGLVLFAKTPEAYAHLRAQFAAQTVKKTYLALVEGNVERGGELTNDLIHMPGLSFCKMVDLGRARICEAERRAARPMRAVTRFAPIAHVREGNEERTLLEVTIFTGVTHQIRAQLSIAGMPVVNDRVYGAFAVEGQIGHCLHALAASFVHPATGAHCEIRTSPPAWADGRMVPAR